MNFNLVEKRMEIVSKLFLDDVEKMINKKYALKVDISKRSSQPVLDSVFADYFKKHLIIGIDGKIRTVDYLGYEIDKDAVWCYLEISKCKTAESISVKNDLLFDEHVQQSNIIHVTVNGKRQSTELINPKSITQFSFE